MLRTLFAIAALTVPVQAQQTFRLAPLSQQVMRYDIAGIRLGMSIPEALAQAKQRQFSVFDSKSDIRTGCNFQCNVLKSAAARRGVNPKLPPEEMKFVHMTGPREQMLEIVFSPSPRGQIVSEVRYGIRGDQITEADFVKQADAKYAIKYGLFYCFEQEPRCNRGVSSEYFYMPHVSRTGVTMSMMPNGNYRLLSLSEGKLLQDARAKQIAAAIDAAAPMDAKPAF